MQVISEQAHREKGDLERVKRKLAKIAARQRGTSAANINEHYICESLSATMRLAFQHMACFSQLLGFKHSQYYLE